jgi:hypothetical protein
VLKKSAYTLRNQHGQDIGLLEMDMVTVDDHGDRIPEGVIKF